MAIFLTSVDILDTGFLTVTGRTNQLSTANRANSGSAIKLKGVELEISSSSNLDDETYPAQFDDVSVPVISVNPDTVRLTIFLNKTSTSTSPGVWNTSDMSALAAIFNLPKTRGFKALYYPVARTAVTTRKQDEQILTYLGRTDTSEDQGDIDITIATGETTTSSAQNLTDVNYIPVRFSSCDIKQDSSGKVMITLEGVRTA